MVNDLPSARAAPSANCDRELVFGNARQINADLQAFIDAVIRQQFHCSPDGTDRTDTPPP